MIIVRRNKLSKYVKFDSAAYSYDGKTFEDIKLEELVELKLSDYTQFSKIYPYHLYCPEYYKPQLLLVENYKTKKYYLRGFPKQLHSDDCYKGFELVKPSAFDEFVLYNESSQYINCKLKQIVNKMLRKVKENKSTFLIKVINRKCSTDNISEKEIKGRKNVKQLPHKSITAPFDEDDFGVFKLFYGNVDMELLEKENKINHEKFYILLLYKRSKIYKICSLTMNKNVAYYLMKIYKIELNKMIYDAYISFAAKLNAVDKFKNGRLIHSDFCIIGNE